MIRLSRHNTARGTLLLQYKSKMLSRTMNVAYAVAAAVLLAACGAGAQENTAGLAAFRNLSLESVNLTEALYDAILDGNLAAAQRAYAASRPPYEQIEVLAGAFPDLDSDIDARPYAFTDGEAFNNETEAREAGRVFKGFHRVEYLLFRERNTTAAEWWAAALVNSSIALSADLLGREEFEKADTWAGMIALATEVGAKKFSSEEETFSDLSILIFNNNFKGIQTQFDVYHEAVETAAPEVHERVDEAFDRAFESLEPYLNKTSELGGVTPYSEVPIAARKEIQAASYNLAAQLKAAAEVVEVEEEDEEEEEEECTPTVRVATFAAGNSPLEAGLEYFRALMPYQIEAVENLTAAIQSGSLPAARAAYSRVRYPYEQMEVLAPNFPQIDSDIDAREYSFDAGENSTDFKGFHRLERLLFRDNALGPATLAYAQELEESVEALNATLYNTSAFAVGPNFEGIIGVATEVVAKKISSEEETSSNLSRLIFYNNWKGIYSQVYPYLGEVPAALRSQLDQAVRGAAACLDITTADDILAVEAADVNAGFAAALAGGSFGNYSDATPTEKECIAVYGYRVRDAVIRVAREANLLDDCHPNFASPLRSASPNVTFVAARDAATVPDVIAPAPATPSDDDAEAPEASGDDSEAPAPAPSDDDASQGAAGLAAGSMFVAAAGAVALLLAL